MIPREHAATLVDVMSRWKFMWKSACSELLCWLFWYIIAGGAIVTFNQIFSHGRVFTLSPLQYIIILFPCSLSYLFFTGGFSLHIYNLYRTCSPSTIRETLKEFLAVRMVTLFITACVGLLTMLVLSAISESIFAWGLKIVPAIMYDFKPLFGFIFLGYLSFMRALPQCLGFGGFVLAGTAFICAFIPLTVSVVCAFISRKEILE